MVSLADARERLAAEWDAHRPTTPEEVAAFYEHADGLVSDLHAWHQTEERQLWTRAVVAAAKASGAHRIIDVGAGLGHDLRALQEDDPYRALGAVEPNQRLSRALTARGFDTVPWLHQSQVRNLDMAVCIDVLEHVPDPEALLTDLIGRLRMGGILVEATATHDAGTPLHLPELRGWLPNRLLDRHGFVLQESVGRLHIWRRVQEQRGTEPTLLLCYYRALSEETAEAVATLKQAGWRERRHRGDALISRVRSIAVSNWLRSEDGDVFLMVDDDIVFTREDAEKVIALARETESIACAAYPVQGGTHLACRALTTEVQFGPDMPPVEIKWAATGFMAAHRKVCEALAATMPLCHPRQEWAFWPLFWPSIYTDATTDESEYLSEDWAFCERARALGFQVWLDPSVIIGHAKTERAIYTVHNMQGVAFDGPITDGG